MTFLAQLTADLGSVNALIPVATVLYEAVKAIWLKANPGKTDADFEAALTTAAGQLVTQSDAILIADGYTFDASGTPIPPAK